MDDFYLKLKSHRAVWTFGQQTGAIVSSLRFFRHIGDGAEEKINESPTMCQA